ncbi:unnamed protein product [Cuscuta campestris]|uniref:Pseudouridine synthase n=1 Tax=Cuscuta campestris TaxID=132261 RepID=A0A484L6A6_9ASTE|nr:unnamed protein product [Cuscuta campestris]
MKLGINSNSRSILLSQNPRFCAAGKVSNLIFRALSNSPTSGGRPEPIPACRLNNYSGIKLEETVGPNSGKLRIDSWISSRVDGISRARVQSSIRAGLVSVNGRIIDKVSHTVKNGDKVNCEIAELQRLTAEPEDIPLDIVYEDDHVLVVNKPAQMVVHPAPGNATGTLVNGILHHCSLPIGSFPSHEELSDGDVASNDDMDQDLVEDDYYSTRDAAIRPGIVHRLDKGTSGLLVVAKDEHSHAHLAEQFKKHSTKRVYVALTCGVPAPASGRIDVPVGRDPNNRLRMAAGYKLRNNGKTRDAASRYQVIEILAGGGSALVEWRLETGRTHQIRAHAKYLGTPLLGDEVYGGTKVMALSLLKNRCPSKFHGKLLQLASSLERPCLHALTLGFTHPKTGESVHFTQVPPADFAEILTQLRTINTMKVL